MFLLRCFALRVKEIVFILLNLCDYQKKENHKKKVLTYFRSFAWLISSSNAPGLLQHKNALHIKHTDRQSEGEKDI